MTRPSRRPSTDIGRLASEWAARQDAGLTAKEERQLRDWCATDPLHEAAFRAMTSAWETLDRPRVMGQTDDWNAALGRAIKRRSQRRRVVATLACVALLSIGVLGTALKRTVGPTDDQTISEPLVSVAKREVLPDGTVLESTAGTRFRVDFSGAFRRVELIEGEAFLQVFPDKTRPFVVRVRNVDVRAVGTMFSVRSQPDSVSVLVTEGRVAIDAAQADHHDQAMGATNGPTFVDAGQKATVELGQAVPVVVSLVSKDEQQEALAWRHPYVEFVHVPLSDVVAFINGFNRPQIMIDDPRIAKMPLSGRFRADDAEAFISILHTGFGLRVEPGPGGDLHLRLAR